MDNKINPINALPTTPHDNIKTIGGGNGVGGREGFLRLLSQHTKTPLGEYVRAGHQTTSRDYFPTC